MEAGFVKFSRGEVAEEGAGYVEVEHAEGLEHVCGLQ